VWAPGLSFLAFAGDRDCADSEFLCVAALRSPYCESGLRIAPRSVAKPCLQVGTNHAASDATPSRSPQLDQSSSCRWVRHCHPDCQPRGVLHPGGVVSRGSEGTLCATLAEARCPEYRAYWGHGRSSIQCGARGAVA